MSTHETKRAGRVRAAIAALLASGAMFAGSASVAVADPAVSQVTGPTSENRVHSGPLSLGRIRAVVEHGVHGLENQRLQSVMNRRDTLRSMLSNILKRNTNHSTENLK